MTSTHEHDGTELDVVARRSAGDESVVTQQGLNDSNTKTLGVSWFERVSALLMSVAMFLGIMVGLLFLVWLTTGQDQYTILDPWPESVADSGRADHAEGLEQDFLPPGEEEVEDLLEPTMAESVQAIDDAVSRVPATLVSLNSQSNVTTAGDGNGDRRRAGPEGDGEDIVPAFERWMLKFQAKNARSYAVQLDHFGIELATIGGIEGVDYVANMAGTPVTRHGDRGSEKRLYFMWTTTGPLQRFDTELLVGAGLSVSGKHVLKFVPAELERELVRIEMEYAREHGHDRVAEISQTVFESRPVDGGYRFEVLEQKYRRSR